MANLSNALSRATGRIAGAFLDFVHALKVIALAPPVHALVIIWGVFWVLAFFFVSGPVLIQITNYTVMAVAIAVIVSYIPNVIHALERGGPGIDRVGQLTIGIVLAWSASTVLRSWSAATRIFDLEWMRDSPWIAFFLLNSTIAGILHLTAPGAIDGRIPGKNWVVVGAAIGIGVFIAGVAVGMGFEH